MKLYHLLSIVSKIRLIFPNYLNNMLVHNFHALDLTVYFILELFFILGQVYKNPCQINPSFET